MTKILVPTDFSPTAENALRFAIKLALTINGEIILYHVFTPLENLYIETAAQRELHNASTLAQIQDRLDDLKNSVQNEAVSIKTAIGRSPITKNVIEFAEANHIEMIIMGTKGASGIRKVVLGSEAARIIEESTVPVFLIPDEFSGDIPKQILFTTTSGVKDKDAVATLLKWMGTSEVHVALLHISDNETKSKNVGLRDYIAVIPETFKHNLSFKRLESSYAKDTIEKLVREFPYDMLAMVRRRKSLIERIFLPSISREVAYLTEHPLLVFPEK